MKKNIEEAVRKVNEVGIEVLKVDKIYSSNDTIFKCTKCGYEWKSSFWRVFNSKNYCPNCARKAPYTIKTLNSKLIPLGFVCLEYSGKISSKSIIKCLKCDYEWETIPDNIIRNKRGCPKCANQVRIDTIEKANEVLKSVGKEFIECIEYGGGTHKISTFRCKKCGYTWSTNLKNVAYKEKGCKRCSPTLIEQYVINILEKNNINYIFQKKFENCKNERILSFDFYLPEYNICIEADGQLHYKAVKHFGGEEGLNIRKQRDNIKNKFCKENDIILLRIPYYEIENGEKMILETIDSVVED